VPATEGVGHEPARDIYPRDETSSSAALRAHPRALSLNPALLLGTTRLWTDQRDPGFPRERRPHYTTSGDTFFGILASGHLLGLASELAWFLSVQFRTLCT